MENVNLKVRSEKGKNANFRLRQAGNIPAVMYSNGTSEAVQFNFKEFYQVFGSNISLSKVFNVNIDGSEGANTAKALVKDYQIDPVTSELLHVDFFKVEENQVVKTKVAVKLVGVPKGIKIGGVVQKGERFVGLECVSELLPEIVEVDITELNPGDSIRAQDIKLADGIKLTSNKFSTIVSVNITRKSQEEDGSEEE